MRSCGGNVRGRIDCYMFHVEHDRRREILRGLLKKLVSYGIDRAPSGADVRVGCRTDETQQRGIVLMILTLQQVRKMGCEQEESTNMIQCAATVPVWGRGESRWGTQMSLKLQLASANEPRTWRQAVGDGLLVIVMY
jgi:hypothetical protein